MDDFGLWEKEYREYQRDEFDRLNFPALYRARHGKDDER